MHFSLQRILGQRRASNINFTHRAMGRPGATGMVCVLLTFEHKEDVEEAWEVARGWYRGLTAAELASPAQVSAQASAEASGEIARDWRHYSVRYFLPIELDFTMAEQWDESRRSMRQR